MYGWRELELYLPSHLSAAQVTEQVRAAVINTAADGGDFVCDISIGESRRHSDGWVRWKASYLAGPPGLGRIHGLEAG
ncbi:MAG: hypothetical protein ACR2JM_16600 [Mycobacterium sp.]